MKTIFEFEPKEIVINDWVSNNVPVSDKPRFYVYLRGEFEGFDMDITADNYLQAFEKFLTIYK